MSPRHQHNKPSTTVFSFTGPTTVYQPVIQRSGRWDSSIEKAGLEESVECKWFAHTRRKDFEQESWNSVIFVLQFWNIRLNISSSPHAEVGNVPSTNKCKGLKISNNLKRFWRSFNIHKLRKFEKIQRSFEPLHSHLLRLSTGNSL